jgi:hypothetical protein
MGPAKELLNNLVGRWNLSGQMGETPLQKSVVGRWTLGGMYNDFHPFAGYYRTSSFLYSWNGQRDRDELPFQFNYESGPFINRFIWDQLSESWRHELMYLEQGQQRTFADKRMIRHS